MLLPRVLTAAVGIPLLLYLIHLGNLPYLALVVGISALCCYEYGLVLWLGGRGVQRTLTTLGGGLLALAVGLSVDARSPQETGLLHLALTGVLASALLRELLRREHSLDRAALTVFGAVYIGWTLGHLVLIRRLSPGGEALSAALFVSVWATDCFAYVAGKTLGRSKLAPVISPHKTWEGAAAGVLGAVLTFHLARRSFAAGLFSAPGALALGVLVGVVGQLSDLGQSLVKRASGVKDSSSLLPGHGGVFDRMDSFFLLAPLFYYALVLVR